MVYHRALKLKLEGTAVLAEIFMLRLENQLRAMNDAYQSEILRFVPLPVGTLPAPENTQTTELKKI
jgi:hypothetical protein